VKTYGKEWLQSVGEGEAEMTTNECQFCHSQGAPEPVEQAIKEKGYFEHQSLLNRQLRRKATLSKKWKAVLNHFSFLLKNIFFRLINIETTCLKQNIQNGL
jgi:hypothetical protein